MATNFIPDVSLYFYKKLLIKSEDFSGEAITINYLEERTGIYHMAIIGLLVKMLENKLISFKNGQLSNGYIRAYKANRESFERIQHQKMVASMISSVGSRSSGVYDYKKDPAWQRIADEYCDLGKETFEKLSKNEQTYFKIGREALEKAMNAEIKTIFYLTFELNIDKVKLKKYLNDFLEDFTKNKFNVGLEYAYSKQVQFISTAIQKLINDGFPKENLWLNPQHLFPKDRTIIRPNDEKPVPLIYYFNFIPTVLAMEKEGFLTVLDMFLTKNTETISDEIIRRVNPFDQIWKEITQIRIRVEINDKFNELLSKNTETISNPVNVDATLKNARELLSNMKTADSQQDDNTALKRIPEDNSISYEYAEHSETGTLRIGNLPEITFRGLRAKIIHFFYSSKKVRDEYKNYADFNNFCDNENDIVKSDEFSKDIKAINNRAGKESKRLAKEIIIKKDKGQINETNYYKFM